MSMNLFNFSFILGLIILILFGAKRIPQLMRSLGSGMREFKKGARGEMDEEETSTKATTEGPQTSDKSPGDNGGSEAG